MPQLVTADFAPQLIWLAITFVALYLVMWQVALPRIRTVLEERQSRIDDDLMEAERLKRDADDAIESYEKALSEARTHAHATAAETRESIKARGGERRSALEASLNREMASALDRIESARAEAKTHVRSIAGGTARHLVERLSGITVTDSAAMTAVDAELARQG
jgi:F-type H+-transporting ATPase subunit b